MIDFKPLLKEKDKFREKIDEAIRNNESESVILGLIEQMEQKQRKLMNEMNSLIERQKNITPRLEEFQTKTQGSMAAAGISIPKPQTP